MIYFSAGDVDCEFAAHILQHYWFKDEAIKADEARNPAVFVSSLPLLLTRTIPQSVVAYTVLAGKNRTLSQLAYDFVMMCRGGGLQDYQRLRHFVYRCQCEPEVLSVFADGYTEEYKYLETKPAYAFFLHDRNWSQYLRDDGIVCCATYAEKGMTLICSTRKQSTPPLLINTESESLLGVH
jgi:hypothetical protein